MISGLYDLIFVGGGLANGLAAYRLHQLRPQMKILLIEADDHLGGNHTWSFHKGDLSTRQRNWVRPFVSKTWSSYEVQFPSFKKRVPSDYYSIRSNRFHHILSKELGHAILYRTKVEKIEENKIYLNSGEMIQAKGVLDGRGWQEATDLPLGYQKFLGMELTLSTPHEINQPILMDATVPQEDGYRFFYLLPWSKTKILIEDTRFSNSSDLDPQHFRDEIIAYIEGKGWNIEYIDSEEKGCLPLPMGGQLQSPPGSIGMRAGFFHSTTGYSFPTAVRISDSLCEMGIYNQESILSWSKTLAAQHWKNEGFFRLLNRFMFLGADAKNRFKIFEKFYRLPDDLIARFYSGQLSALDRIRILSGKPPIPLTKAIKALF